MPEQPVNHLDQPTVPVDQPVSVIETSETFEAPPELQPQPLPPDRVTRLYQAIGFLAGVSILLLGILSGFTIWLLLKQSQLEQQVEALSAMTPEVERIRSIDQQVKTLNQQIKGINQRIPQGLANQLKSTETQLTELNQRIENLESDVANNGQTNDALQKALKNVPTLQRDNNSQGQ